MKSTYKLELIVISSPSPISNEAENINSLFETGLGVFHLRKPDSDLEDVAMLLSQIDPKYYDRIAIHQHHQLADEFGLKRLHFTETERSKIPISELIKIKERGMKISTSIHNISALNELSHFDYTFFSPVFDSISKNGYKSSVSADFVLKKPKNSPEVVALGGIHQGNIDLVKSMSFDGVAVLGTIWNEEENRRIEILRDLIENYMKLNSL
jgi:thiamine-phosphate pyrophosphorylase